MHWPVFADYSEKIVQLLAIYSKQFDKDMFKHGYRWFNNVIAAPPHLYGPPPNCYGHGHGRHGEYGYWRWGN